MRIVVLLAALETTRNPEQTNHSLVGLFERQEGNYTESELRGTSSSTIFTVPRIRKNFGILYRRCETLGMEETRTRVTTHNEASFRILTLNTS
jgi:hypothetical protein